MPRYFYPACVRLLFDGVVETEVLFDTSTFPYPFALDAYTIGMLSR